MLHFPTTSSDQELLVGKMSDSTVPSVLNTEPDLEKSLLCYWDKPELMKAKFFSYLEGQMLWLALHSPLFLLKIS